MPLPCTYCITRETGEFVTDDFDGILARVEKTGAEILDGLLVNPNSHQREVWLRAPEGYVVVAAGG